MKTIFSTLFIFIVLCSCNKAKTEGNKHPSFSEIEEFFQTQNGIDRMNIVQIHIKNFNLSEYKKYKPNNTDVEIRSFEATYNLILKKETKNLESKAELISSDNVNWRIKKLTIIEEADSIGKHYEKTMEWEYPDSLKNYNVLLKINN